MINQLVKESVKGLKPYNVYSKSYLCKTDANESPFNLPKDILNEAVDDILNAYINRYPDNQCKRLKVELSRHLGVSKGNIILGNGSDEMIGLITNTFIDKGDSVISHEPTFSMYKHSVLLAGGNYIAVPTKENFLVNINEIIRKSNEEKAKVIFLCSPNNPTGNTISKKEIIKVINKTNSIVVVDEAYIEFGGETMLQEIERYSRLVILRTFSKAFGAAAIRTGYLIASKDLIYYLNSVKSPYNLNTISQIIATRILKNKELILDKILEIKKERDRLINMMERINKVKVYSSETNFILFKVEQGDRVFQGLLNKGIIIRRFKNEVLKGHLRVTVGTKEENDIFINGLKEVIL
ncbi:histidinol-phosphate transaminase [Dethiothermospora halolimnae]|uniref:histidinol-phosphate transaminase n=1 Tax=Dethiothermospora halolimnae TaxID=3114390 RepID=UPI003CCBCF5E